MSSKKSCRALTPPADAPSPTTRKSFSIEDDFFVVCRFETGFEDCFLIKTYLEFYFTLTQKRLEDKYLSRQEKYSKCV
jgi:hypothetical protein